MIHIKRRKESHTNGGLDKNGNQPPPSSIPPLCSLQTAQTEGFQRGPSVRDEETWQPLSTGAVPTALHTVQDLLLQFLPLLLLLGQTLSRRLRRALAAVQDFAVLSVPQIGVQAARGVQEGVVAASLGHLALKETSRREDLAQKLNK